MVKYNVKAAKAIKEMGRSSRKVMKDSQKVIDEVREAAVKRKKKQERKVARKQAEIKRASTRETAKGPKPFLLSEGAKKEITRRGGRVTRRESKVYLGAGAPQSTAMRKRAASQKKEALALMRNKG